MLSPPPSQRLTVGASTQTRALGIASFSSLDLPALSYSARELCNKCSYGNNNNKNNKSSKTH